MAVEQYKRHSCYTCAGFGERRGLQVWCVRHGYVNGSPETGCAYWVREPGADDEGEPPLPCTHWDTIYAEAMALRVLKAE